MSLTSALSAANSGLSAAARSAELVSTNVANALVEGYGRREIRLSAAVIGGAGSGVQVAGVDRVVDQVAIGQRRLADAALGQAQVHSEFFRSLEISVGTPDNPASLSAGIAQLEGNLVSAISSPESDTHLNVVVNSAKDLVEVLNTASNEVQQLRLKADQQIGLQINFLNSNLLAVAEMNNQIRSLTVSGSDASGAMDQRQQLIDQIAELVPMRELPREHGRIALVTSNGTILVDNHAAEFGFETTEPIVPEMTLASGGLSGLTILNAESTAGTALQAIAGGALASNFGVRDSLATDAQIQLDTLARELIERTSDISVDPTLGGGPGLFTDENSNFDPAAELGLASRLTVNSLVNPSKGGAVWKIRDGVGALVTGTTGNTAILSSILGALGSGPLQAEQEFSTIVASYGSSIGTSRNDFESKQALASAQVSVFREVEGRAGVDTDQEMQKLLTIEQSYAANAKIIQVIDEMMQSLLRI